MIKEGVLDAEQVSAAVGASLSVVSNLLLLAAVMHSLAVMALAIWPQTLIKVASLSVRLCALKRTCSLQRES